MKRTAVITQPTYLPWLGYFEQMAQADVFVILDTVQFERRSWQNRNRLKNHQDEAFWLTVPLEAHDRSTPIREIKISQNQDQWQQKHLASISSHLGSAPHFAEIFPQVEQWLLAAPSSLADLNITGLQWLADLLGLRPEIIRASALQPVGHKTELLVNLCEQVKATDYYSAAGSKAYMDLALFEQKSITVHFQDWPHPIYTQLGRQFVSHLSVVDVLMNVGWEQSAKFLKHSEKR